MRKKKTSHPGPRARAGRCGGASRSAWDRARGARRAAKRARVEGVGVRWISGALSAMVGCAFDKNGRRYIAATKNIFISKNLKTTLPSPLDPSSKKNRLAPQERCLDGER